eukprot:SAG31_NODE_2836_length_5019_cov_2.059350_1_plen_45_part_10
MGTTGIGSVPVLQAQYRGEDRLGRAAALPKFGTAVPCPAAAGKFS